MPAAVVAAAATGLAQVSVLSASSSLGALNSGAWLEGSARRAAGSGCRGRNLRRLQLDLWRVSRVCAVPPSARLTADKSPDVGQTKLLNRSKVDGNDPKSNPVATLKVTRTLSSTFPTSDANIGEFFASKEGRSAVLNLSKLRRVEDLGNSVYRCYVGGINFLSFSVEPVVDIRAVTALDHCTVEMLQCRLVGPGVVEQHVDRHFAAALQNKLTWRPGPEGQLVTSVVDITVELEVYTMPFKILPLATVEVPGNQVLLGLLAALQPAFLSAMQDSYVDWAQHKAQQDGVQS
eukprot:jgi/Chlat1/2846/Chrsp194S00792